MTEETILVVDDNTVNLAVLESALAEQGLRTLVAQDGEEALQRARRAGPDVILLDVMLPGLDGFETCRLLKADPVTRDIPVIFMTALADPRDKLAGFAAGGVDYVTKPFQITEVVARVRTHLELYVLRRQLAAQNEQLSLAREELERRVLERTAALAEANTSLESEIQERKRAERELQASSAEIRDLYNNAPCGYHSLDGQGRFVQINNTELDWLGYTREELLGKHSLADFLTPESRRLFDKSMELLKSQGWVRDVELQLIRRDGGLLPVLISATAVSDATGCFLMSRTTLYDLSERKRTEERIRYVAHHDALTGLPNRSLFQDRLGQLIAHAPRHQETVAVLLLDLDQFKQINDSLGHEAGDLVLKEAAVRIGHALRKGDTLARWAGDEFVMALAALDHDNAAALIAENVREALKAPLLVYEHELHLSGSMGVSLYPADGQDAQTLLRAADTALYHAKQKGRGGIEFFTPALTAAVQHRMTLASQLRRALGHNELYLDYQPQVELDRGRIFAAEALVRWRRPDGGTAGPEEFIPIAEEMGLIEALGAWVLREACRQIKHWRSAGHPELTMAINVSVQQLHAGRFEEQVAQVLAETGCPPEAVELEITENTLMQPSEANLRTLNRLNEMGVSLTIDDFGIGYSSMAYLQRFPIHALKIDRSFVAQIGQGLYDGAIAAAIIAMAQSLHLRVLAEGVETAEQVAFLKARGCLTAQGHYYGKPVSPQQFEELLGDTVSGSAQ